MARPDRTGQEKPGWRRRKLALGLGTTLALLALGLGAVVLVAAADGPVDPPPDANGASPSGIPVSLAVGPTTAAPRPSPTPTPTPVPTPDGRDDPSPEVTVGGDQPLGPLTTAAVPGIPENTGASPQFLALRDVLAREIAAYSARVGGIDVAIAVTDIQTGETISVGGNVPHRTGCTINMFALLAAVGEFQAGRADPQSVASNIRVGIGGSYPPEVKRFLERVFPSYQAGLDSANELMRESGMVASEFHQVPYYQTGTEINQLTATDVNRALSRLYRGEMFNPEWTAYTLARLREVNWGLNYMLPGRLPASATVAHKIGFYSDLDGWVNNDAGIVTFTGSDGKEKAYAITYLSQQARTEYTGYSFGAHLSGIVWDWFEAKYQMGTEPPPPPPSPPSPPPPTPEPTPAPQTSPTPTPTPTSTPAPTPTPTPTPTPSPTPEPTPEPTPTP